MRLDRYGSDWYIIIVSNTQNLDKLSYHHLCKKCIMHLSKYWETSIYTRLAGTSSASFALRRTRASNRNVGKDKFLPIEVVKREKLSKAFDPIRQ